MKTLKRFFYLIAIIIIIGLLIPQNLAMPVVGATSADYNPESFWYYPWGKSGTHKGVDIFAATGTNITSSTKGFVVYKGTIGMGGNVLLILGPKWRLHYYAHLNTIHTSRLSYVNNETIIGTVGTTGNAAGKAPHLHYSILSLVPHLWKIDGSVQGWKKMFYIDPIGYLEE